MNIGILVPPYWGHIFPTLSVGKELISRGHKVYWISLLDKVEGFLPEGGVLLSIANDTNETTGYSSNDLYGMQSLFALYQKVLSPLNNYILKCLPKFHESLNFDFIISDHQTFAGALFAEQNNIPYASSVTAPAAIDPSTDFPEVLAFEQQQVLNFQMAHGFDDPTPLSWSAPLVLVYITEQLLQKYDFPESYRFIGPSIRDRREPDLDISDIRKSVGEKPMVLVSLGSLVHREEWFIDLLTEAFSDTDITIVLIADPQCRQQWPENFIVHAYIPQMEVISLVNAVVCHAGQNTVCETLSFGIPLVTLPIAYDQSYVARKVQQCGAGIRLKYRRLKATHLRLAVNDVLSKKSYGESAKMIQASFVQAGGEMRAADEIEKILHESSRKVVAS